ncbi:MAG: dipeptidase [Candidatus Sericytochromatia bacterium]
MFKADFIKKITLSLSFLFTINYYGTANADTIKKEEISSLINLNEKNKFSNFKDFLKHIEKKASPNLLNSIKLFKNGKISSQDDFINIYRLLGIYARISYKDDLIKILTELVAIPTYKKNDLPQYQNPEIIRFGKAIEKIAKDFGLEYKNIDNRIFEVTLKGSGKESFGVYTHADVVPTDESKWVLNDGTKLNPYKLTVIDEKIYGRGTEDDKCSIVVTLFAMKLIKENNLKLKRSIRLLIETTEETSGEGIEYFKKTNKLPDYNIVLDSSYPVVTAEKGFGVIKTFFPLKEVKEKGAEIVNITGGLAYNQIPSTSVANILSENTQLLENKINSIATKFISENGNNFKISTTIEKNGSLNLQIKGKSAHSASPQNGINPIPLLCLFIKELDKDINFKKNNIKEAIDYVNNNFGLDFYGKKLGIDYKDDFMGPLTTSVTYLNNINGEFELAVNLRAPKGKEPLELKKEIEEKLAKYKKEHNSTFKLEVSTGNYMYRDIKGNWINTLLNVFGEVTGKEAKPISTSGGTTAKQLINGVSFGPSMPGEEYTGHTDNEFKKVQNFLFDIQMFTEMFLRIGNLEKMD